MPEYRRRAGKVTAVLFDGTAGGAALVCDTFNITAKFAPDPGTNTGRLFIRMNNIHQQARAGNYVIKLRDDKYRVYTAELFAMCYELVET
jgi:hypothetical protein